MGRFSPARLRRFVAAMAVAGAASIAPAVHAEEPASADAHPARQTRGHPSAPDPVLAFVAGATTYVLGFGVGASLIGADSGRATDNAGWVVMQSGFAAAPLIAHGVAGEWGRGLLFASPPFATTAGTVAVIAADPKAVRHSALPEQRILWTLFAVGLFSSAYGIVDSAFADVRARRLVVAPTVGAGAAGVAVEGTL